MGYTINIIIVGLIFDMLGAIHLALPIILKSKKQSNQETTSFPFSRNHPYVDAASYEEKEYIKFGSLLLLTGFLGQLIGQLNTNIEINVEALVVFMALLIVYFFIFNRWLRKESNKMIPKEFKDKYGER